MRVERRDAQHAHAGIDRLHVAADRRRHRLRRDRGANRQPLGGVEELRRRQVERRPRRGQLAVARRRGDADDRPPRFAGVGPAELHAPPDRAGARPGPGRDVRAHDGDGEHAGAIVAGERTPAHDRDLQRVEVVRPDRLEVQRRVRRGARGILALRGERRHVPARLGVGPRVDGCGGDDAGQRPHPGHDRVEHLAVTGAIGRRARERQLGEQEPVLGEAGVERAEPRQAADEDAGGRDDGDGQRHLHDDQQAAVPRAGVRVARAAGRRERAGDRLAADEQRRRAATRSRSSARAGRRRTRRRSRPCRCRRRAAGRPEGPRRGRGRPTRRPAPRSPWRRRRASASPARPGAPAGPGRRRAPRGRRARRGVLPSASAAGWRRWRRRRRGRARRLPAAPAAAAARRRRSHPRTGGRWRRSRGGRHRPRRGAGAPAAPPSPRPSSCRGAAAPRDRSRAGPRRRTGRRSARCGWAPRRRRRPG